MKKFTKATAAVPAPGAPPGLPSFMKKTTVTAKGKKKGKKKKVGNGY